MKVNSFHDREYVCLMYPICPVNTICQVYTYVLISNSHNVQCVQHINIYGIPSGVQCVLISTGHMSNVSDMSSVSFVHLDLVCLEYSLVSRVSLFLLSLSTVCPMRKMSSVSNEQNV